MKSINLLLLTLLISVAGCKKEQDAIADYRIKSCTTTVGVYSTTFTYEYTEDGKIKRETDQDGFVVNYTYSDTSIVTTNAANSVIGIYTLNSEGYVSKSKFGGGTGTYYYYDSEGHRIKEDNVTYTWVDGNQVTGNNGSTVYNYITDRRNTIGNENRGMKYLGVDSKNLFSSIDFGTSIKYYNYQYDSKGRVAVRSYDNVTATFTYY